MRGFISEVILPIAIIFLIVSSVFLAVVQIGTSWSCNSVGNLYNVETKTAALECYVNTPIGWVKQNDFEIGRIVGKF